MFGGFSVIDFLDGISNNYIEILNNIILLFGLGFLYAASNVSPKSKRVISSIILGMIIGLFTLMIMFNPWSIQEGLIFDVRSVILSVSAYFFGLIPAVVSMIFPIIHRIIVGGSGVYSGVFTILVSVGIGLSWHHIRKVLHLRNLVIEFYLFGLIVHLLVWSGFVMIPYPNNFILMRETFIPFIIVFPVVSMLLLLVIKNQKNRIEITQTLQEQELLLKSIIDSPSSMEIFALDLDFKYLAFNRFHQESMNNYYGIDINVGDEYLNKILNSKMRERIWGMLNQALKGDTLVKTVEIETSQNKFYEERYTPIIDKNQVVGITVISYEVTDRKNYETSILYLSYYDHLTGLGNRRLYQEKIVAMDINKDFPLSIVMADINGLKLMNDAFSHDAGDELLVKASQTMSKHFNNHGEVYRIGGDEFVILLPNCDDKEANQLINELNTELNQTIIKGVSISVSFGFSTAYQINEVKQVARKAEENMYAHKIASISSNRNLLIKTLQKTLYENNPREEAHCKRVSVVSKAIGEAVGLDSEQLGLLEVISFLHDIGKIAIDEEVLNKTDELTSQEWDKVKKHPEIGYRILSTVPEYYEVASDILSHHERYDGNGYPRGLKGEQIPLRARILSLADAYDAMVNKRPYNEQKTHEAAIIEIKENRGTQFDPNLVDIFIKHFGSKPFFHKKNETYKK
ncbi:MAG TPA: hypothetical protein DEA45_02185 [Acholeplasmataceae bacterium]|nr:hypothetical protein [Acholeplasmataceae bacterium]